MLKWAWPARSSVPPPIALGPSLNVIDPAGNRPSAVIDAVKVNNWPNDEGLRLELKVMAVGACFSGCVAADNETNAAIAITISLAFR